MSSVLEMENDIVAKQRRTPPPTTNDDENWEDAGGGTVRLNTKLIRRAAEALMNCVRREGTNRGVVLNRAIQLYEDVTDHIAKGWQFQMVNPKTNEVINIRLY